MCRYHRQHRPRVCLDLGKDITPMNPSLITDMASAFYQSSILFTASDAGIFDYLADHPLSDVYSIAHAVHFDVRAATLLLDACVALRLLEKKETTYQN
ncbi:MAG: hypothetical protein EOL87_04385, partial [Spartobacteria bacterium]|nr:hypothetical protein [Spartobacteria bacterium]